MAAPVSANARVAKAAPVTPHAEASSVVLPNEQPDALPFSLGSGLSEGAQPELHTYASLAAQDTEALANEDTLVHETQGFQAEPTSELFAGAGLAEITRASATLGFNFAETQYRELGTAVDLNAQQFALSNLLAETITDEQDAPLLAPDLNIDIAGKPETLPVIDKMTVSAGELKADVNDVTAVIRQTDQFSVSESTVAASLTNVSLTADLAPVPQRSNTALNGSNVVTMSVAHTFADDTFQAKSLISDNVSSLKQPLGLADNLGLQQFLSQQAIIVTPLSISPLLAAQSGIVSPTSALPQWQGLQLAEPPAMWGPKLLAVLSDKVVLQLGQQVQRAQIRLDPPQLGNIELRIAIEGEKTTVQLFAANAQVREAMQQTLELLRLNLGQQLGASAQIDVQVGDQRQQQGAFFVDEIAINQQPDFIESEPLQAPGQQQLGWLNRLA